MRHDRPYPFSADVRAGATRITAHGELPKPFDFGQIRSDLTVSGPNFADLYYLTGLALPTTPAYRLSGELLRDDTTYTFHRVAGRVGASDLEGMFKLDREADDRPDLQADLAFAPAQHRRPRVAASARRPRAPARRRPSAPKPPGWPPRDASCPTPSST